MLLPENLPLLGFNLPTIFVGIVLGLLFALFVAWFEARKDGFDDKKIFDILFSSVLLSTITYYLLSRYIGYASIYDPFNIILKIDSNLLYLLLIFLVSFGTQVAIGIRLHWSVYRLLDIYSISFSFLLVFFSTFRFLVSGNNVYLYLSLLYTVLYIFIFRFRGYTLISGYMFSLFCFSLGIAVSLLYKGEGYLLFLIILVTIGLVNLYFRRKKNKMQSNLNSSLLNKLKSKLLAKDRELNKEEAILTQEDPFLQGDRSTGNSESMDEAILEDSAKELHDIKMSFLSKMRLQVKKALAAIKIGSYGICEDCKKPIDKARLTAYPEATTCLECSEKRSR